VDDFLRLPLGDDALLSDWGVEVRASSSASCSSSASLTSLYASTDVIYVINGQQVIVSND